MGTVIAPLSLLAVRLRMVHTEAMDADVTVQAGYPLFGKVHGVLVPTFRGNSLLPRRSKSPLCGTGRVMVTSAPFVPSLKDPATCEVCSQQALQMEA